MSFNRFMIGIIIGLAITSSLLFSVSCSLSDSDSVSDSGDAMGAETSSEDESYDDETTDSATNDSEKQDTSEKDESVQESSSSKEENQNSDTRTKKDEKHGLSLERRKTIFWDLVYDQDRLSETGSSSAKKMNNTYKVIAEQYAIEESVVKAISDEGISNEWPMPAK